MSYRHDLVSVEALRTRIAALQGAWHVAGGRDAALLPATPPARDGRKARQGPPVDALAAPLAQPSTAHPLRRVYRTEEASRGDDT
jgi:hypothetical protein